MTHPRRFGLLLVTCIVLQVILVESSKSVSAASIDGAGRNLAHLLEVHRANRIVQESGLLEEFQHEVIIAEGRTRKHKNRSDPYGGGGDNSSDDSNNKKKNGNKKNDGGGTSSAADVGISAMAKGIMVIMKERRHVSGGSDKSKGLYPKELRDRLFDRLDIRNKGDEDDRDTFRQAIERLVGKDLIRINKHGRVKLIISMDSSRSKRKDGDGDDDDDDDDDDSDDDKNKQRDKQKDKVRDPYDAGTSNGDSGDNELGDGKDSDGGNNGGEGTGQQQDQQDSGGTNTDLLKDSDGDGYTDAEEILKGSDPNDASSTPRDPNGNGGDDAGSTVNGDGGGEGSGTNEDTTSGAGVGEKCMRNGDCNSRLCGTDGICKTSDESDGSSEPDGSDASSQPGGGGETMPGSNGSACQMDQDCDTNVCVNNVCSRPKRGGESCDSPYDCLNGTCGKVSLSSGVESVCCESGKEERGICTGQPDGSPCVLMSSSSPEATVTVVLDDVCASSYCNLNAGGVCDSLPSEETTPGSGVDGVSDGNGDGETTDDDTNVMPTDPNDGDSKSSEGDSVSPAGSSCDAGCIAAVTVPVSIFILIVVAATTYSIKKRGDTEGNVVEGDMEAPVGMVADDINDPMGSSHSDDNNEAQPLVASSAVAAIAADGDEASEGDDIVYVDQEEADGMESYDGDEEAPEANTEVAPEGEEDANGDREEDWG